MRAVIGGCFVAATLATSPAHGENYTDYFDAFLNFYEDEKKQNDAGYFTGYLDGVAKGIMTTQVVSDSYLFCVSDKLNVSRDIITQALRLKLEELKANPKAVRAFEEGKVPQQTLLTILVVDGLKALFPCN